MKRVLGLLLVMFVVLAPSVGQAGGWAVASLDSLPPLSAGRSAVVGFRLLQHGVTPVVAADWPDAEIGVAVRSGGDEWFVAADPVGDAGHFEATVAVPAGAADVALQVQMRNGLFVSDDWLTVDLAGAPGAAAAGGSAGWLPAWTAPLFALAAVGCAGVVLLDVRDARRRRAEPATPGLA